MGRSKSLHIFAITAIAAATYGQIRVNQTASPLELPLSPVPIARKEVPLATALSEAGTRVRNGYVLFGLEMRLKNGKLPVVNLNVHPGSTLGVVLAQISRQLPGYEFNVVSEHLINIHPARTVEAKDDPLNFHVTHFDVANEMPDSIISRPQDFIPELNQRLAAKRAHAEPSGYIGPGLRSVGPTVTLHLSNVTVREILNAVAEATGEFPPQYAPFGWVYSLEPDPKLPGGGKHTWGVLWSAPHDWKQEAERAVPEPPN